MKFAFLKSRIGLNLDWNILPLNCNQNIFIISKMSEISTSKKCIVNSGIEYAAYDLFSFKINSQNPII